MPTRSSPDIEPLMNQLWQLLELAIALATQANAEEQLGQIALLCEEAETVARKAAAIRWA
jgi:hypothetical protein